MKILLLGANGQLGRELCRCLAPLGSLTSVARHGHDHCLDLSRFAALDRLLGELAPEVVVNAAAYTAVDRAEDEAELCGRVNRDLPAHLARYAAAAQAVLVHYSTDYVFDGMASTPYTEKSVAAPTGVYAKAKYAGETAIRESGCHHLILRTAWVYSNHGRNFLNTILTLARQRSELSIVDDQIGTPTWARSLAQLTAAALLRVRVAGHWQAVSGTYHVSANGAPTSWYGFAEIFLRLAAEAGLSGPLARLRPVGSEAYPTRARRPPYSVLDNRHFEDRFELQVPQWQTQLRWCMEDFVPLPGTLEAALPAEAVKS